MENLLPLLLFITGVIAIFIEFFVPAFGIIGVVGIGSIVVATVFAFKMYGNPYGYLFLVISIVGVPGLIMIGLKNFPRTFFGKKLILWASQKQEEGFVSMNSSEYSLLMDKEGITITKLRPSGIAEIEGKRVSVVTEGEMIDRGRRVKVIKIEGMRIVVREAG